MIRIKVAVAKKAGSTKAERLAIERYLDERCPNWGPKNSDDESCWGQLKPLFLDLQQYKCAYCEKEIGGRPDPRGGPRCTAEQDVEHYRPKGRVNDWQFSPKYRQLAPRVQMGADTGYPWLKHNVTNYLAACKSCNIHAKKSYFPILERHADYASKPSPKELSVERPLLLFPLGELDVDPEDLLDFVGFDIVPARAQTDPDYWRALATIECLQLQREDLLECRKVAIFEVGKDFLLHRLSRTELPDIGDKEQFAACRRAFKRLLKSRPMIAREIWLKCAKQLRETEFDNLSRMWKPESSEADRSRGCEVDEPERGWCP